MALGTVYRISTGVDNANATRKAINSFVFTIALPILAFQVLSTAPLDSLLLTVPLVSIVTTLVCLGIGYLVIPRLKSLRAPSVGALLLAAAWGNVTYLGLPVLTKVGGLNMQRIALLYDLLAATPLLFTVGTLVCVRYGTSETRHTIVHGLRMAVTTPPMIGAVVGIVVNMLHLELPTLATEVFTTVGGLVAPLMVCSVGMALSAPSFRMAPVLAPSVGIKLVVSTAVGYVLCTMLIADTEVFRSIVLESAMPSMVLPLVFAERYGLDHELLAQAILWSTVLSMGTLPIVAGM